MTADPGADGHRPEDDHDEHRDFALLGQYRLVQRLGEGGMGVVHLALDRHGRAVAVKVLRPSVAHDPDARARLTREVETLSRIRSRFVAPVVDADVDGETPYLVTRYVPGPPLDEHVADRGPLPPAELHRVAAGLAEALDAIHSADVVHRDVKPGNVLLVDGEPVLIDFGIAHVVDDVRLTSVGLVMGTPGYLAPEVVHGEDVTPATDWWGWAATTAFAASGNPPFGRGGMSAVLARVSAGEPDLRAVDPRIEPLLYAALSPDLADRPHQDEVVRALASYAHGAPVTEAIEIRRVRPSTEPLATPRTSALPAAAGAAGAAAGVGVAGAAAATAGALGAHGIPGLDAPPAPAGLPAPVPGATGVPAGPPGWEQARPVDRGRASPAPVPPPPTAPPRGQLPPPPTDAPGPQPGGDLAPFPAPQGDPRIGRPSRTGTLLSLLALQVGLTVRAPLVALLAFALWTTVARTADRSVTSLVLRRHERGERGSDVAVAVAAGPWHAVVGVVGTVVTLALPLLVGVSSMFAGALFVNAAGGDARADGVVPLAMAGGLAAVTAWWGPGGASLRRGSRSLVRGMTGGDTARQVVAAVALVAAAVLVVLTVTGGGPSWWPEPQAPSWVADVVPSL